MANLAISVWSIGLLDREQRWASEQIGTVLAPLHRLNRAVWSQSRQLGREGFGWFSTEAEANPPAPTTAEARSAFSDLQTAAMDSLADLDKTASGAMRSGVNTTRNIRERLQRSGTAAELWFGTGTEAARITALQELYELHELVERIEARLIQEAPLASEYSVGVRRRLGITLAASVLLVGLFLLLADRLFRRWVLVKAELLRRGAEVFGTGDLSHRIPVRGDDELDRAAGRLNEMAGTIMAMQAERIERERLAAIGEMARRVAHNIRNPLAGIRSLAELSMHEIPPNSPLADHQHRIIRTVDRFGGWLNELLSVSTVLEVSLRPTEIRPWLTGLIDALGPMADDRAVRLVLDDAGAPATAPMDRRHLEHAVSAVVTNAIEISPRGGTVTIRVREVDADTWDLCVEDDGPGIGEEALANLFRPYFTTKKGGTGIGLAIAQRVVREHHGTIRAENLPFEPSRPVGTGPGARFRIELPLATAGTSATISQE
ncbi:MAG: HAMP domain-containing histidine kinase [Phycisphaerales bacterium]|nr:HAMP domain-containing histidine kinase [Phycisphaerales bacterium]